MTHVYAKQLVNGLEVSDGNINVNVGSDGEILSWGNSFYKGDAPAFTELDFKTRSVDVPKYREEHLRRCGELRGSLEAHKNALDDTRPPSGPWGFAKKAAQVWFGKWIDLDDDAESPLAQHISQSMFRIQHHLDVLCQDEPKDVFPDETKALASFLSRVSSGSVDATDLDARPMHSLQSKLAPAEPPTSIISGTGLKAAGVVGDVPARYMMTQMANGPPRPVWRFDVEMKNNWYEAYVDAVTGDVLRVSDWAADFDHVRAREISARKEKQKKPAPAPKDPKKFSYQVFPWGVNDPTTGNLSVETEPWDSVASPLGWHTFPTSANPWPATHFEGSEKHGNLTTVASTVGNNVLAHEDWAGRDAFLTNYRPVSKNFTFVYDYGEPDGLAPKEYIDMVVTQLFYTCNKFHDLTYRLGFNEESGNFQMYNFGKKYGRGGDPVIANAQDGSGFNNANFMTPPDGTAPRMRMYVWDTATPYRDGDLEAGIVIHEYSHGVSTRLTGEPSDSGCLGWGEAGGMGEGWGDAIATLIRQVHEHKNFKEGKDIYPMGAWAANQDKGIRNFKYSTNNETNPSTYKTLDKPGYWGVHAIGEVWAEILFVMSQRLVEKHGFSDTLFPPEDTSKPNDYYINVATEAKMPLIPKHGNTLALQLIINGMKLQPCRPSFFDARDAIILADKELTGGENACIIWKAFAERGLGADAEIIGQTPWGGGVRKDGFKVPTTAC